MPIKRKKFFAGNWKMYKNVAEAREFLTKFFQLFAEKGGNRGSGRTRFWMHTDCIQQIQGRVGGIGARQGRPPAMGVDR